MRINLEPACADPPYDKRKGPENRFNGFRAKLSNPNDQISINNMSSLNTTTGIVQKNKDSKGTRLGKKKAINTLKAVLDAPQQTQPPKLKAKNSALSDTDKNYIELRESLVDQTPLQSFKAMVELEKYKNGIAWKPFETFEAYAQARFGFKPAHTGRALRAGRLLLAIEKSGKAVLPDSEIQIRHVLNKIPQSHQVECWEKIAPKGTDTKALTGPKVKEAVAKYWKSLPQEVRDLKPARAAKTSRVNKAHAVLPQPRDLLETLIETTMDLSNASEIHKLLFQVEQLIRVSTIHVDSDPEAENTEGGNETLSGEAAPSLEGALAAA